MKNAVFITHPQLEPVIHKNPWEKMTFNAKNRDLPAGNGLLTLCRFFDCTHAVSRVTVRATALGIFDLCLNDKRVGVRTPEGPVYDELKPGWTDYRCRVFRFTYDVTDLVKEENCLVAQVAPGWWSGRISFGFYGFKVPAFWGEIDIEYADGTRETIVTDENWDASICGPVMTADIWDGEYYDARMPRPGDFPGAYPWVKAVEDKNFTGEITDPVGPPIRVRSHLNRHPLTAVVHQGIDQDGSELGKIHVLNRRFGKGCEAGVLKAGENIILDMGQNMVGRPLLTLKAPRGTTVKVYVAEFLNDSGESSRGNDGPRDSMYIKNYRSALARAVYVTSGKGTEVYHPTFTFYGFRYLELTADNDIEIVSVEGQVIGSDMEETSSLVTGNAEVNKLISNILWGQRGNYLCVPTDCPQRDERLGWTGDTQIFCGAGAYQMNTRGFMHKWLQDARDSQVGFDGGYCDVIPRVFGASNTSNSAWSDAALIVPYHMYLMYNDVELIAEHYDSMESYMTCLTQYGLSGPRPVYGDWLNYEKTDNKYISICYYAYDAQLMTLFSRILGKKDREEHYRKLEQDIIAEFRKTYMEGDDLTIRTQTSYLLALKFHLVEDALRPLFIERLRKKIEDNHYTLSTGFVGTGVLNQTLSEVGLDDLCYSLLLQTADPSWLYSVRQGATTIWERWNSYTLKKGFGDVGMNSFNHYAYGAVLEWMYKKMAGISPDPENPGFKHIILCPTPDTRKKDSLPEGQEPITWVKATYKSVSGLIKAAWEWENGQFVFKATVPDGTTARVEFPLLGGEARVNINGQIFTPEELNGSVQNGKLVFEVTPGEYTFKSCL